MDSQLLLSLGINIMESKFANFPMFQIYIVAAFLLLVGILMADTGHTMAKAEAPIVQKYLEDRIIQKASLTKEDMNYINGLSDTKLHSINIQLHTDTLLKCSVHSMEKQLFENIQGCKPAATDVATLASKIVPLIKEHWPNGQLEAAAEAHLTSKYTQLSEEVILIAQMLSTRKESMKDPKLKEKLASQLKKLGLNEASLNEGVKTSRMWLLSSYVLSIIFLLSGALWLAGSIMVFRVLTTKCECVCVYGFSFDLQIARLDSSPFPIQV
jgi:hypothetical protein